MFSADLISPEDVRKMALLDSTMVEFDVSEFKFIHIRPVEFKLVATQVTQARLEFLYSWRISLIHKKVPDAARHKVAEFLGAERYGPLKICL